MYWTKRVRAAHLVSHSQSVTLNPLLPCSIHPFNAVAPEPADDRPKGWPAGSRVQDGGVPAFAREGYGEAIPRERNRKSRTGRLAGRPGSGPGPASEPRAGEDAAGVEGGRDEGGRPDNERILQCLMQKWTF